MVTANNEKMVMTVEEAGRLVGVSRPTAYKLVKAGQLPAMRLGRRLIVPKAALERWLLECKPASTG